MVLDKYHLYHNIMYIITIFISLFKKVCSYIQFDNGMDEGTMETLLKESLTIENFAGIQQIHLELNRINLLIGPQATGKSICAKLLYFFKSIPNEIGSSIRNYESFEDFRLKIVQRFERFFPNEGWGADSFSIRYGMGDSVIEMRKTHYSLLEAIMPGYDRLFEISVKKYMDLFDAKRIGNSFLNLNISKNKFQEHLTELFGPSTGYTQLFIPAGRSFFAYLQKGIFKLLSNNNEIDPFFIEFGSLYEIVKSSNESSLFNISNSTDPVVDDIVSKILLGKYSFEKGKDYLNLHDGRHVNIANSSSGQQESLPLVLMLRFFSNSDDFVNGASVYIEEPEAHIFPTGQKDIVDLISVVFNCSDNPLQFIITTHSPYILTSFNNLMQAGILKKGIQQTKWDTLYNIVPQEKILDPSLVSAYSLNNGTAESIIDRETGLISANSIDEVSDTLSIQFGELLEMENDELFREM